jgi:hypothetical protein
MPDTYFSSPPPNPFPEYEVKWCVYDQALQMGAAIVAVNRDYLMERVKLRYRELNPGTATTLASADKIFRDTDKELAELQPEPWRLVVPVRAGKLLCGRVRLLPARRVRPAAGHRYGWEVLDRDGKAE